MDSDTKKVIKDLSINDDTDEGVLHRELPKDVSSIKTI